MSLRIAAALIGAAMLACAPFADALAAGEPIPGVDIIVEKNPGGIAVTKTRTDGKGEFVLKDLPMGDYTIELPGKSLMAATKTRTGAPGAPPPSRGAALPADADGDAPIIGILVALLLPANPAATKNQTHREKASAKGIRFNLTVPDAGGKKNSYKGQVTVER